MKKLFILILTFLCLNACAQTPPGFKGQVYSDIQDNGYEWVNVDGKQHTIAPKQYFCMAEFKQSNLAPKYVNAPFIFDKGKIAGFHVEAANDMGYKGVFGTSWAIWWPENTFDDQAVLATLNICGRNRQGCQSDQEHDYKKATYYITCLLNTSPKSEIKITPIQPDLINAGKN